MIDLIPQLQYAEKFFRKMKKTMTADLLKEAIAELKYKSKRIEELSKALKEYT
jgi:hypothetical protein